MFSVIDTLKQAIQLGIRHFWLLLALSAAAALPSESIGLAIGGTKSAISFTDSLVAFFAVLASLVTDAMKTAAVLGVLNASDSRFDVTRTVVASIRTYTWTLIRISILLMLITFAVTIPIGFFAAMLFSMHIFAAQVLLVLVAILYLVFIKYALADPLVVVENMRARDALKKSWQMTQGRFGYVLGCYVFLGTGEYSISTIFTYFVPETPKLLEIPVATLNDLGESLWILTAWCMYLRIREADGTLSPRPATESPPESPSASRSA